MFLLIILELLIILSNFGCSYKLIITSTRADIAYSGRCQFCPGAVTKLSDSARTSEMGSKNINQQRGEAHTFGDTTFEKPEKAHRRSESTSTLSSATLCVEERGSDTENNTDIPEITLVTESLGLPQAHLTERRVNRSKRSKMSRGGRGGGKGGGRSAIHAMGWEDTNMKLDSKPSELFPVCSYVIS